MTSSPESPALIDAPTTSATVPTSAADHEFPAPHRHHLLVAMIVVSVVIATLAMVVFIWYRWHGVQEPTSAIVVQGDETLDGTEIFISGPNLIKIFAPYLREMQSGNGGKPNPDERQAHRAPLPYGNTEITEKGDVVIPLAASNQYRATMLVEPGEYMVTVQRQGQVFIHRPVEVKRFFQAQFNLSDQVKRMRANGELPPLDTPPPSPSPLPSEHSPTTPRPS